MPRKRGFKDVIVPTSTTRICYFCQKNVSSREIDRKAHEDVCIGMNVNAEPTAAGSDTEVGGTQNLTCEQANDTHEQIDDMDSWTAEDTDDEVFIDHETAGTEEYYEDVHDEVDKCSKP
jgi:hypothetical protein